MCAAAAATVSPVMSQYFSLKQRKEEEKVTGDGRPHVITH